MADTRFKKWYRQPGNKSRVLKRMKKYWSKNKESIKKKRQEPKNANRIKEYNRQYWKRSN